jgi:hypothetical protein
LAVVLTLPWRSLPGGLLSGGSVALGAAGNAAIIYYVSRWLVGKLAG